MYCTVSWCTMWLSFATLLIIVWKRSRAASPSLFLLSLSSSHTFFLSLSLSLKCLRSCLASFCPSPSQASVLRSLLCVFFTILFLLSRPGMQVTYEFSLSVYLSLIYSQPSSNRCSIGCILPLYLFFSWVHK